MIICHIGYKLRKHISSALQQRSKAIHNSIEQYNTLVKQMKLSRPTLTWEQVINYAFLADFDVLRDCRDDVSKRPWANPASCALMDDYFKVIRAKEEITRLNIEIRRVVTYLRDEERFLQAKERELSKTKPLLAHQIKHLRLEHTRFTDLHMSNFHKLSSLPEFIGDVSLGQSMDRSRWDGIALADSDTGLQWGTQENERDREEVFGEEEEQELQELEERLQIISAVLSTGAEEE